MRQGVPAAHMPPPDRGSHFPPAGRGRDIECWCPLSSRWCHIDTIIDLAAAAAN